MADLKDSVALVTSAGRDVGRGVAQGLAEAGATIYLIAETETVQETASDVADLGGRGIAVVVDRTDDAALLNLFRRIESEAGRLDLLINTAPPMTGPPSSPGSFWEQPLSIWDDECGTGLRSCYVAASLAARLMVEQGSGLIINLSGVPDTGSGLSAAYGVCSVGMDRMVQDMARELAEHRVAALSVAPARVPGSPRYLGRCIAALAMDPDVLEKTGARLAVDALQREYRFSELTEGAGL